MLDPNISQAAAHVIDLGQQNSKQVWQDQQLSLTAHPVHHEPVFPAFGYMLKFKNCNVFVTGDTRVFKKESNIVKNADVVISEAMSHPLQEKRLNKAKRVSAADYKFLKQIIHYHSDSLELAKMAEKANVKHLFLTHLDPSIGITQAEKQDFVAGMDKYYSGSIAVADDMDELVISSDGNGVCQVQYIPANKKN